MSQGPDRDASGRSPLRFTSMLLVVAVILALTLLPSGEEKLPPMLDCLVCGDRGLADLILNVLLFVPLGVAFGLRSDLVRVTFTGAALSTGIEVAQLFVPGRDTSVSDVVANTTGAVIGWLVIRGAPRLVALSRRRAAIACAIAAALPAVVITLTGVLFRPGLPRSSYYGQWTPNLGHLDWYRGRVLRVTLGSFELPSRQLDNSDTVRVLLLAGVPLAVHAIAGPFVAGLAPIFSMADEEAREILLLGASRTDLVFRYRTRAAGIRLNQPDLRVRGAFRSIHAGDSLTIVAQRERSGYCIALNGVQTCSLKFSAGRGWAVLLYPQSWPPWLKQLIDGGWLASLFAPLGFSSATRRALWWVGALGLGLGVVPALVGLAPTPLGEWLAAVAGVALGASLRALVARGAFASVPARTPP